MRRWYLKNGYADVQIVSAVAEYDPARSGFVLTFTIEEGERYRFGAVDIQSNVRDVDPSVAAQQAAHRLAGRDLQRRGRSRNRSRR